MMYFMKEVGHDLRQKGYFAANYFVEGHVCALSRLFFTHYLMGLHIPIAVKRIVEASFAFCLCLAMVRFPIPAGEARCATSRSYQIDQPVIYRPGFS
jgi:hypothetical protein